MFINCLINVLVTLAATALVLLSAGCGDTGPHGPLESEVRRSIVIDDLGRQVLIKRPLVRVISLAPSVTESVFAAGAGDRLVGVTTYCNFPAAAGSIEKIGDTQTPSIERIIALKPDIVLVSTASQLESFMQTLEQQSIAVYVTDPKGIGGVIENVRILGKLFGTDEQANKEAAGMEKRAALVDERINAGERPKVFVQISREPLFTIGKDSFLTEIVERAGGDAVTKGVPTAFPKLSKETALAMDPEVILLSDSEDNREPNEVFRSSKAVRNGRVYRINADIISRPGPRLVDALEQIAGFLHK